MPLFVAPQVVEVEADEADDEDDDDRTTDEADTAPTAMTTSPNAPRTAAAGVAAAVVAAVVANRADPRARTVTIPTGSRRRTPPTARTPRATTTTATRSRRPAKAPPADAAGAGAASPAPATIPSRPPVTIRPTPSCTSAPPRNQKSDRSDRDPDEIQGISGSTRLEAKRQRRRDGRDAGRRRPPILSEAEFLARREAVERVMVVRDKIRTEPPHEGARYTQIAVMEDGVVVEHFVTSAASASLVGNIYLGIVQNVLPSMEAAFVDIGRGRNGVLYAGEVNWEAAGLGGAQRKIEQALKPGDYVVVQVSKDPVGHKGARLTTQVSLAGRYLVYVPGASSTGISRKLPDTERQRLKEILREVVPADAGVIIRTASEGVKEEDIRVDVNRLQERWTTIAEEAERVKGNKRRRRHRALRRARRAGQGHPRPVQRGLLRADRLR